MDTLRIEVRVYGSVASLDAAEGSPRMAWIRVIGEQEADEALRNAYERIGKARGKVANILKIQSLRPTAMEAHIDLYKAIMFGPSNVSREEREMIAVAVSSANHCAYCVAHHGEALKHYWRDAERVEAFIERPDMSELSARAKAMLQYAVKLTRQPDEITEDDVGRLRRVGLSDLDILDIAHVVAYFNFVNRMAVGLGVEFSDEETQGYKH